jgi:voltage-gated potassium channel
MSEAKSPSGLELFKQRIYEILEKSEEDGTLREIIEKWKEDDKDRKILKEQKKDVKKSDKANPELRKEKRRKTVNAFINWFLVVLICVNIIAVIAASVDGINTQYSTILNCIEYFSIAVFTIEYLLRLWVAPKKGKFIFSPLAIVDILAILPFYLPLIFVKYGFGIDLRILRVFRLFRIFKLVRYNKSFQMISKVLKNEKDKLIATIFIMVILILFAASMMYFIENYFQRSEFFPNIPATLWWAIATLTTVGYGDVYPVTVLGKLLGGLIAVLGIGLVAMPSGIIAMGLIQEVRSSPADPENIYSVFDTLGKYQEKIYPAVINACNKLTESSFKFKIVGNQVSNAGGYGSYFSNTEEKDLFFGINPLVCKEKDGANYVYSLCIRKELISYKSIDKINYPYITDDNWVFIQVDKNIYEGDDPVGELCDVIVEIVKKVYLPNMVKKELPPVRE